MRGEEIRGGKFFVYEIIGSDMRNVEEGREMRGVGVFINIGIFEKYLVKVFFFWMEMEKKKERRIFLVLL